MTATPDPDPLTTAVFDRAPLRADVIDAHAHLGPYSRFYTPDPSAEAMIAVMDRCGVDRTVVSSCLAIELDSSEGNAVTAAAVAAYPDRIAGYLVVNPHQDPEAEIARWADDPAFVGVKLHPSLHNYPLTGPDYTWVWEYAAETGRPVLTHTWHGSEYDDPTVLARVAERHPDVNFLCGHSGALPSGLSTVAEIARRLPNVYLEICGTYFTRRGLHYLAEEVGCEQIIYGSDFPFIDLRYSIGRVVFAELSLAERTAMLGETFSRLFGRPLRKGGTS